MNSRSSRKVNELDPDDCVCSRLRRTARIAAKAYDSALKTSGLRNTQFTLLASVKGLGETNIGNLADYLGVDGTTLTRNLEVLVRRGLIEDVGGDDARVRNVRITRLGRQTYRKALPKWRQAQQRTLDIIGLGSWTEMKTELGKLEATFKA